MNSTETIRDLNQNSLRVKRRQLAELGELEKNQVPPSDDFALPEVIVTFSDVSPPAEPVAAEPVAAEPVAAEPVAAEPVAAESVATESIAATQPETKSNSHSTSDQTDELVVESYRQMQFHQQPLPSDNIESSTVQSDADLLQQLIDEISKTNDFDISDALRRPETIEPNAITSDQADSATVESSKVEDPQDEARSHESELGLPELSALEEAALQELGAPSSDIEATVSQEWTTKMPVPSLEAPTTAAPTESIVETQQSEEERDETTTSPTLHSLTSVPDPIESTEDTIDKLIQGVQTDQGFGSKVEAVPLSSHSPEPNDYQNEITMPESVETLEQAIPSAIPTVDAITLEPVESVSDHVSDAIPVEEDVRRDEASTDKLNEPTDEVSDADRTDLPTSDLTGQTDDESLQSEINASSAELAKLLVDRHPTINPAMLLLATPEATRNVSSKIIELAEQLLECSDVNRLLVIDGQIDNQWISSTLDQADSVGLAETLHEGRDWRSVTLATSIDGLSILPAGNGLLTFRKTTSDRLAELCREWKSEFDMILVDGGVTHNIVNRLLSKICDAAYLMVKLGETKSTDGKETVKDLRANGARLLGSIIL